MNIKKGDTVKVITGDSKGRTGKVLEVRTKDRRVVVEGVNVVSRHTRPSNTNPDGGILKFEAPIAISNVQLLDPKTNELTRVRHGEVNEKKVRVSSKTGNPIDK